MSRTVIYKSCYAVAFAIGMITSFVEKPLYGIDAQSPSASALSREFVEVSKKATPCVVSIKTQVSQKKWSQRNEGWGEPIDPFQDDFWQRFFGFPMPPQQRQEKRGPRIAQGSGFVISSDGYILTNAHVVQDGEKITVIFNTGKEYIATLVGEDPNTDIALLKIDAKSLPFLTFTNSDDVEVGEWVIAIGNPLGLKATVTTGIVSAKGRNDLDIARVEEFIQTDAAINRGNSGGCLLNLKGKVVGMNTAIASNTGGYMGIGFAIPSNLLLHVKDQILKHGKVIRGYLGIILQPIDNDLAQAFNLNETQGALITEVVKGGPAEQAGLLPGDAVLKVNGKEVSNFGALRNFISMMAPNTKVVLTVKRDDKLLDITATVQPFPETEEAAQEAEVTLGIIVDTLSKEVIQKFGYRDDVGVFVKYVSPESIAFEAGLKKGDLILSVNRIPVTTRDEFYKLLNQSITQKRSVLLHVKSGQHAHFISLRIE